MKGTYILVLKLSNDTILKVGSLGEINFSKGYYLYVGSAMGARGSSTLINRLKRHLSDSINKKIFWHIDYLLQCENIIIIKLYIIPSVFKFECNIAKDLLKCSDSYIKNFGSSDCTCKTHLLYFKTLNKKLMSLG